MSKMGAVVMTILAMAIGLHLLKYSPILPKQLGRSHWASCESIDEIERQGRDYHLKLNNGDRAPASRGRASEVLKSLEKFNTLLKN